MAQITRRNILLAGLALPSIAEAVHANVSTAEGSEKPKRFEEVIGFEVAEAVSGHPIGILPLGSLEFHGPHNPLGTDSIIISGIAERVAARTRALLFPAVTFTQCPAQTSHFTRTISVPPEGSNLYCEAILSTMLHRGLRNML